MSGSPPVITRIGFPTSTTWSIRRKPSSVDSSSGSRQGIASARQWMHESAQARVISQASVKGLRSKSTSKKLPPRAGKYRVVAIILLLRTRMFAGARLRRRERRQRQGDNNVNIAAVDHPAG